MGETQFPGVKHLTGKTGAPSVDFIAKDRIAQMLEVDADLMGTPAVERAFEQGPGPELQEDSPIGAGSASVPILEHGHSLSVNRVSANGGVNGPMERAETATRQSKIDFGDFPLGKLPGEAVVG